jgi:hypothetical protein
MSTKKRMLMAIGAVLVAVFATMATGCANPTTPPSTAAAVGTL